jgi:hypothetical protein
MRICHALVLTNCQFEFVYPLKKFDLADNSKARCLRFIRLEAEECKWENTFRVKQLEYSTIGSSTQPIKA